MINREMTHAELLKVKNELLKAHAEIFKKARDLDFAIGSLGTLPTFRDQSENDIEFVVNQFEQVGLSSCLIKE